MVEVKIKGLYDDSCECDDCGGGVGTNGYVLTIDEKEVANRKPIDHCCSPTSWSDDDVIKDIVIVGHFTNGKLENIIVDRTC